MRSDCVLKYDYVVYALCMQYSVLRSCGAEGGSDY